MTQANAYRGSITENKSYTIGENICLSTCKPVQEKEKYATINKQNVGRIVLGDQ